MSDPRVLIVDDDELVGWALERALSSRHFSVEVVHTLADARASFRRAAPEIVVLDIHLPDGDGLDLLEELHRHSPGTRVMVLSSDATADRRRQADERGAWRFVEKPFEVGQVTDLLATCVG